MGKPFSQELKKLESTYTWAISTPIDNIDNIKNYLSQKPLFVVGSGGSLSACVLFSMLQQFNGSIATAITPLDLQYLKNAITHNSFVAFISASGKNTDILIAFDSIIKREPQHILSICLKKNSRLSKISGKYTIANTIDLDNPAGKDGFLATNSLLAYYTIISRLYSNADHIKSIVPSSNYLQELSSFTNTLNENFTLVVLYGGWGKPVAVDLESKFSEAGLGNVLLTDYRNFGHGRHNWFDKKPKQSAIVALISPDEIELAEKTLELLPSSIPVLKISSLYKNSNASIDLLVKSFYLVEELGRLKKIDPGRPGVPEYGSKLYHLKYSRLYPSSKINLPEKVSLAISRKIGNIDLPSIQRKELMLWENAYQRFTKKINNTLFKGLILDYDGTICSDMDRFTGPTRVVTEHLTAFLKAGLLIGVTTGRGKSVRNDLQLKIPKKYWNQFIVGYYNGSQIGTLADNDLPIVTNEPLELLTQINKYLLSEPTINSFIKSEIRPGQLTVVIIDKKNAGIIKNNILDSLTNCFPFQIQVLESSHSVDIIPITTSKVSIIQACHSFLDDADNNYNFLCIGDNGKWPGNDYQLLANEYSLSVDKVSLDPNTCWNLSSVGNRCVQTIVEYFEAINLENAFFRIKL
jgi:hydroxymethylpyrimidine pyrophosphatase-like HAD family hydrolase/D-arabinose 5-phosphate isomerase GutQ